MTEPLNFEGWVCPMPLRDHPNVIMGHAGAVKYRKYNWLKRLLMKTVVYFAGGDTDTSHDHEYTDWEQIDSFTLRFKQRVRFAEQPSRIASPPQSC